MRFSNARTYGRWLGARFKNVPNIIWVNGGDRVPTGFESVYREGQMNDLTISGGCMHVRPVAVMRFPLDLERARTRSFRCVVDREGCS